MLHRTSRAAYCTAQHDSPPLLYYTVPVPVCGSQNRVGGEGLSLGLGSSHWPLLQNTTADRNLYMAGLALDGQKNEITKKTTPITTAFNNCTYRRKTESLQGKSQFPQIFLSRLLCGYLTRGGDVTASPKTRLCE
jgi:hypothetical protein